MKLNQQRGSLKAGLQQGVALVITLIMLSVITLLAIAFLVLSRRDKGAVDTVISQTRSKNMADTALARAQAELAAKIMAQNSLLVGDMMVTRNFINPAGFDAGIGVVDTNNVNYDYKNTGPLNPLSADENAINIGNLFFDPRPPVFVKTNVNVTTNDFRFYHDFNRSGSFDTNGFLPALDGLGNIVGFSHFLGDPEWIGVLEKPELPHSGTNRFIGRYAFVVLPEGQSLDINFIHNYAKGTTPQLPANMTLDGFHRNQGFGSWEINLAGFFHGLNTNYWGRNATNAYIYKPLFNYPVIPALANVGPAFDDARSILTYRYGGGPAPFNNLLTVQELFDPFVRGEFETDKIDGYADDGFSQAFPLPSENDASQTAPWVGSVSRTTNAFFDIQEIFDPNKTSQAFVNRLRSAGTNISSYDQNTFYRLLSQLGTDSKPEKGKIHLNYDNITPVNGYVSQTNVMAWTPKRFFTNTAEALLQRSMIKTNPNNFFLGGFFVGTNFGITNIPIYPTNHYTTPVHRLLQLSANIYGATQPNRTVNNVTNVNPPVVFRPQFSVIGGDIVISGYEEVTNNWQTQLGRPFRDLNRAGDRSAIPPYPGKSDDNVFGVPWVISAAKGFPNFNEFELETIAEVTRKIEMRKPTVGAAVNETNLMYLISITNSIGFEVWNSYTQAYTRALRLYVTNFFVGVITNEFGVLIRQNQSYPNPSIQSAITNINLWPSAYGRTLAQRQASFVVPLQTNLALLPKSQYTNYPNNPYFFPSDNPSGYERNKPFYTPQWGMNITNRFLFVMVDTNLDRIIDFVNTGDVSVSMDMSQLIGPGGGGGVIVLGNEPSPVTALWNTNRTGPGIQYPTLGMKEQIEISKDTSRGADIWRFSQFGAEREDQINAFRAFLGLSIPPGITVTPTNRIETPFNPTRIRSRITSWQANDPLVHYTANDLVATNKFRNKAYAEKSPSNLRQINDRYSPWGGKRDPGFDPGQDAVSSKHPYEFGFKDPLVRWSDDWDFPTNKFPSIGWLGRVHRGSPWQTIYLKAPLVNTNGPDSWRDWAGSDWTHPVYDRDLIDLFTIAPYDQATRGLLSINQTNFASWAAVLSGVIVASNSLPDDDLLLPFAKPEFRPVTIEPYDPQLEWIVNAINNYRTNRPSGVYRSLGDLFSVPELTIDKVTNSPYLNLTPIQRDLGLNDAAVERIPQQILSLLRLGESRFAVYSFGQALKPAENSILLDPPRSYLQNICTNYQITGEVVTKTVFRVEDRTPNDGVVDPKVIIESYNVLPGE